MYTLRRGIESEDLTDEEARMMYDLHPEADRTGSREGAFILWWRDASGFRAVPMLFRPKRR